MIARLFNDGEQIGHCTISSADVGVIQFRNEFYVYNDNVRGYERTVCERVGRIEYTPKEATAGEATLPFEFTETKDNEDRSLAGWAHIILKK